MEERERCGRDLSGRRVAPSVSLGTSADVAAMEFVSLRILKKKSHRITFFGSVSKSLVINIHPAGLPSRPTLFVLVVVLQSNKVNSEMFL